jgi:hypothetical protein
VCDILNLLVSELFGGKNQISFALVAFSSHNVCAHVFVCVRARVYNSTHTHTHTHTHKSFSTHLACECEWFRSARKKIAMTETINLSISSPSEIELFFCCVSPLFSCLGDLYSEFDHNYVTQRSRHMVYDRCTHAKFTCAHARIHIHARTHTHAHTYARARTHAHTYIQTDGVHTQTHKLIKS